MDITALLTLIGLILSSALSAYQTVTKARNARKTVRSDLLQQEIESLQSIIDTWQEQYEKLRTGIQLGEQERAVLKKENAEYEAELDRIQIENLKANNALRAQLEQERTQRREQSDLIISLTNKLEQMDNLIKAQAATIDDLTSQNRRERERNRKQASALRQAEERIKVLEGVIQIKEGVNGQS